MHLPQDIDKAIRERFGQLIRQTQTLREKHSNNTNDFKDDALVEFTQIKAHTTTLIHSLFTDTAVLRERFDNDIKNLPANIKGITELQGTLKALNLDYKIGLLNLSKRMEATTALNYMGLANELLGEGASEKYKYVPAAVLAGAVLEDALRRLCERQEPPISITVNGKHKMLKNLITDLKNANLLYDLKARQLEAWTTIRNSAAHGQFDKFKREDVEQMIKGIEDFLAEHR